MTKKTLHDRIKDVLDPLIPIEGSSYPLAVSQLEELFDQTLKELVGEMEKDFDMNPRSDAFNQEIYFRNQLRSEILKRYEGLKK